VGNIKIKIRKWVDNLMPPWKSSTFEYYFKNWLV